MPDDTKTQVTEIQPVAVTVIGTGDGKSTGSGAPLTTGTVGSTPDHQPNLLVVVISPLVAIVIRFVNLFLTTLVGLLVAAMTPAGSALLYTSDFAHLLLTCSSLSIPIAGLGFFKDLVTVFGKLEGKYPLLTGSV